MKTNPATPVAGDGKEHRRGKVSLRSPRSFAAIVVSFLFAGTAAHAQVNSGSDGSDGAFNPTTDTAINMADHPDGIYHYMSVKIPAGVTVTFIPNANNTPVVWLVQSNCVISGSIVLDGSDSTDSVGGAGGPGGFGGGNGGGGGAPAGDGLGPGGGMAGTNNNLLAGNGSFTTNGVRLTGHFGACLYQPNQAEAGEMYGNQFLVPLVGGSGGGGSTPGAPGAVESGQGGGGGGGVILVAANQFIEVNGQISSTGGSSALFGSRRYGGGGTGGAVCLVSQEIRGTGALSVSGGHARHNCGQFYDYRSSASPGFIRLDSLVNSFVGGVEGVVTRGFQPVIIPPPNQAVSLAIQSVAGIAIPQSPAGASAAPDVIVPGQQANPIAIVVRCVNIPLNTDIIVDVKPANGPPIRSVGVNNAGTQASSTATVSVTMPRGAGTIQAKAVSGIAGSLGASLNNGKRFRNYAQTGLTADGELFAKMEITATLGRGQEIAHISETGKRYVLPRN